MLSDFRCSSLSLPVLKPVLKKGSARRTSRPTARHFASQLPRCVVATAGLLSTLLCSSIALAEETDVPLMASNDRAFDVSGKGSEISWMPGERWDPLTGTISFYNVDIDIPGNNDLPVRMAHSVTAGIKGYAFDIPRLTFSTFGGGVTWERREGHSDYIVTPGQKVCSGLRLARPHDMVTTEQSDEVLQSYANGTRYLRSGIAFHFGERTVHFFPNRADEFVQTGSQFAGRFPPEAAYISPDNWYITCAGSSFKVHTNAGRIYTMGRWIHPQGTQKTLVKLDNPVRVKVFANKIEDLHGNWVDYTYGQHFTYSDPKDHFGRTGLMQISSNDNRNLYIRPNGLRTWIVTSYDPATSPTTENPYKRVYHSHRRDFKVLDENEEVLAYHFSHEGNVARLTYPSGGTIEYGYTHAAFSHIHPTRRADYMAAGYQSYWPTGNSLQSRTLFDGGVKKAEFTFDRHPMTDDDEQPLVVNLIKTPTTHLEYRVRKTEKNQYNVTASVSAPANSGKVVSFRNHGQHIVWNKDLTPQIQRDYEWKRLPSLVNLSEVAYHSPPRATGVTVSDLIHYKKYLAAYFDAYRVVLERETTRIYPNGRSPITFMTTYSGWDSFGNHTQINEYSNDKQLRKTTLAYWQSKRHWITSRPKSRTMYLSGSRGANRHTVQYREDGLVDSEENNGIKTSYGYHGNGTLATVTDAQGHTHRYAKYANGIPHHEVNSRGYSLLRTSNPNGTIKHISAWGGGDTTTYTYDKKRRLKSVSTPGSSADIVYEWLSPTFHQETQGSRRIETRYDQFGRQIFASTYDIHNPSDRSSVVTRYDSEGRVVFKSLPRSFDFDQAASLATDQIPGNQYRYDGLGRVTEILRNSDNGSHQGRTTYQYNLDGYSVRTTDGRKNWRTEQLRAYGSPSEPMTIYIVDGNGTVVTTIDRDRLGRARKVSRAGVAFNWEYYPDSQLLKSHTNPEQGYTGYSYQADGQIQQRDNQDSWTRYQYTSNNLLSSVQSNEPGGKYIERIYRYDKKDLLASIETTSAGYPVSQANKITYGYDPDANRIKEILDVDGKQFSLGYTYSQNNALSTISYPTGRRYSLAPDARGFHRFIKEKGGKTIFSNVSFFADGGMATAQSANVTFTHTRYNKLDLPARIIASGSNKANAVVRQYHYDNALNVSQIDDVVLGQSLKLGYDNQNRLTSASSTAIGQWNFGYDARDNITARRHNGKLHNYFYDDYTNRLDRIESVDGARRFQYDSRGNITHNGNKFIAYMANNHVVQVGGERYVYDGHGRRVLTHKGDGNKVFQFYDAGGSLRYRYDAGSKTHSEYHYIAGKLVARRDSGNQPSSSGGGSASDCVDTPPTGDGWGWNGTESCRVIGSDDTTAACIDTEPQGDGWGWNGTESCRVIDSDANEDTTSACIDTEPQGDGWGWNGTESCRVTDSDASEDAAATCFDTDPKGDGWGWNGTESCRIK